MGGARIENCPTVGCVKTDMKCDESVFTGFGMFNEAVVNEPSSESSESAFLSVESCSAQEIPRSIALSVLISTTSPTPIVETTTNVKYRKSCAMFDSRFLFLLVVNSYNI